jgi:hypothetical protein
MLSSELSRAKAVAGHEENKLLTGITMRRIHLSAEGTVIVVGCCALLFSTLRLIRGVSPQDLAILTAGATCGALVQRYRGGRSIVGGALGGVIAPAAGVFLLDIWYRLNPKLNKTIYYDFSDFFLNLICFAIVGMAEGLVIWSLLSNPRLPRVRLTIRQSMAGVAIIAVALGVEAGWISKIRQRSAAYHQRAEAYAEITFHIGTSVMDQDGQLVERNPVVRVRDAWARGMAEKYWRLAAYPWLSVEPDPPPPPEALLYLPRTLVPVRRHTRLSMRPTSLRSILTFPWNWHD